MTEPHRDRLSLIYHRLIARRMAHDPGVLARARAACADALAAHPDNPMIQHTYGRWAQLLAAPAHEVRRRITARDPELRALRRESPLVLASRIDFTDPRWRRRAWRKAALTPNASAADPQIHRSPR